MRPHARCIGAARRRWRSAARVASRRRRRPGRRRPRVRPRRRPSPTPIGSERPESSAPPTPSGAVRSGRRRWSPWSPWSTGLERAARRSSRRRRQRPPLRRRAGRADPDRPRRERSSPSRSSTSSGAITTRRRAGLLGLAFHPSFPDDPRFFVDYTDANGDTQVSSFTVDPANPDRADPASEVPLLFVDQPYGNHNGGAVAFGPDGYLYIALGDGGQRRRPARQRPEARARCSARSSGSTSTTPVGDQAYGIPRRQPVRRDARARAPRSS